MKLFCPLSLQSDASTIEKGQTVVAEGLEDHVYLRHLSTDMSTNSRPYIDRYSADMSAETRSILGRHGVRVNRPSVDTIGRYVGRHSANTLADMSLVYRSVVSEYC